MFLESLFLPLDRLASLFSSSKCMYLEQHIIIQQILQASILSNSFLQNDDGRDLDDIYREAKHFEIHRQVDPHIYRDDGSIERRMSIKNKLG
jgi:hypothetical protein